MGIENITPEITPDKDKTSSETKKNFSDSEQKLINEYPKSDKYEFIDPSNMEAEAKKV